MSTKSGSDWEEVYPLPGCRGSNVAGVPAAVAVVASSYGMPTPSGSPDGRGWEAYKRVSNLGVGISTLWLPSGVRFGGVAGQRGDWLAGVAGILGRILRGNGVRRPPKQPPEGRVGKNSICADVRRHVALIAELRIWWIRS